MANINKGRMVATSEEDFVVILLGMRINRLWKIHKWLPIALAMPKLLNELKKHPETGYLGHQMYGLLVVVYWRSLPLLEAYAHDKALSHMSTWLNYRKAGGYTVGDVGLWREVYVATQNSYEGFYTSVPTTGIGHFGTLQSASGQSSIAQRYGESVAST